MLLLKIVWLCQEHIAIYQCAKNLYRPKVLKFFSSTTTSRTASSLLPNLPCIHSSHFLDPPRSGVLNGSNVKCILYAVDSVSCDSKCHSWWPRLLHGTVYKSFDVFTGTVVGKVCSMSYSEYDCLHHAHMHGCMFSHVQEGLDMRLCLTLKLTPQAREDLHMTEHQS